VWGDEPLGTDWQDMSAGLRRELESCGGVVNDRSAMCLSLAFDRFLEIAEELRECGYRPVRVRQVVTAAGGAARVSVVWRRDGGRWRLQVGQQSEQLPGPEDDAVLDGLLPAEVSYVSGKGMTGGWLVLWSEPVESGERRRYVAGLTAAELRAVERMYSEGGFGLQLSLSVRLDEVGVRRYGAVFSSQKVWSRSLTAYDGYEVLEIPQRDCAVAATGYEVSEDARERHRRQLLSLQGLSAAVQATVEFRQARAEVLADVGDALNAVSDMDAVMSLGVSPKPELLMRYLILLSLTGRAEDAAVVLERMENSGTSEEVLAAARVMSVSSRGESEAVRQPCWSGDLGCCERRWLLVSVVVPTLRIPQRGRSIGRIFGIAMCCLCCVSGRCWRGCGLLRRGWSRDWFEWTQCCGRRRKWLCCVRMAGDLYRRA